MLGEYNFSDENIRDALRVLLLKSGARNTLQNRGSQIGKKYVTTQVPQRRSTRPESPIEEVSYFYQQLAGLRGVSTTNAQAVRPRHSAQIQPMAQFYSGAWTLFAPGLTNG